LVESLRRQRKTAAADAVTQELTAIWKRADESPKFEWY
jgi:hypothetical protein